MPVWRCPHCGTPQAESARCWVCRRSTTSCGTCRHFRRGVAPGLGLCGLDPRRGALRGTEMRACWAAPDALVEAMPGGSPPAALRRPEPEARQPRTFVPVDELGARRPDEAARVPSPAPTPAAPANPRSSGWSLWGDADP